MLHSWSQGRAPGGDIHTEAMSPEASISWGGDPGSVGEVPRTQALELSAPGSPSQRHPLLLHSCAPSCADWSRGAHPCTCSMEAAAPAVCDCCAGHVAAIVNVQVSVLLSVTVEGVALVTHWG